MPDPVPASEAIPSKIPERARGRLPATGWLIATVAAVFVPKCVLCVAGYLALVAGLGSAGVEFCGGNARGADGSEQGGAFAAVVVFVFAALLLWRDLRLGQRVRALSRAGLSGTKRVVR